MSANGTAPTYRKLDSTKLSFFDLPGEVREIVYKQYFTLPRGQLGIHLINTSWRTDKPVEHNKYYVSSLYHDHVLDDIDGESELDHVLNCPTQRRTGLLTVSRAVNQEAGPYIDGINHFKIIGDGCCDDVYYHSDLSVIDQLLMANIRRLEIGYHIRQPDFDIYEGDWTQGLWPVVIARMVRLEDLSFTDNDAFTMYCFLELFTSPKAIFIGHCPEIYLEAVDFRAGGQIIALPTRVRSPNDNMSRFIVPPLKTITLRPLVFQNNWNQLRAIDYHGQRLEEIPSNGQERRFKLKHGFTV